MTDSQRMALRGGLLLSIAAALILFGQAILSESEVGPPVASRGVVEEESAQRINDLQAEVDSTVVQASEPDQDKPDGDK